jgi:ElaB/YqjD/DUF883 family membrane-anchored ribosome-binding protein
MARQDSSTDAVASDLGDLRADIEKLRGDLSALAKHMKEFSGSAVAEAQRAGSDQIDVLRTELERTAQQLKRQGEASVAEVEKTIQDRPLLSLAAAFGIGMLVTRLLERR